MNNGPDHRLPELEYRMDVLELRLRQWGAVLLGVLLLLALGIAFVAFDLYRRAATLPAETAPARAAVAEPAPGTPEAEAAALARLKAACHDPRWVDTVGSCIFNLLPGEGYTLTYGAAAAMCAAHGARLCTLSEVQAAYGKGAEWCAWGWVADIVAGGEDLTEVTGTIAYPMQTTQEGCQAGMNFTDGHDITTSNYGANCCL